MIPLPCINSMTVLFRSGIVSLGLDGLKFFWSWPLASRFWSCLYHCANKMTTTMMFLVRKYARGSGRKVTRQTKRHSSRLLPASYLGTHAVFSCYQRTSVQCRDTQTPRSFARLRANCWQTADTHTPLLRLNSTYFDCCGYCSMIVQDVVQQYLNSESTTRCTANAAVMQDFASIQMFTILELFLSVY